MTPSDRSLYVFLTEWCDYTCREAKEAVRRQQEERKQKRLAA